eukprot:1175355-Alexandrium_andersonii.AAC.1
MLQPHQRTWLAPRPAGGHRSGAARARGGGAARGQLVHGRLQCAGSRIDGIQQGTSSRVHGSRAGQGAGRPCNRLGFAQRLRVCSVYGVPQA